MDNQTMKFGNAPSLPISELLSLKGKVCAVEYESRKLLVAGSSREEVVSKMEEEKNSHLRYYLYVVPSQFRREEELVNLSNENFSPR